MSVYSHLSAATPAVADRFLAAGTAMKVGAYAVANGGAMPTSPGARRVTITHTTVGGVADTLGTITFAGTDLRGKVISEDVTPVAGGVATSTKWFQTVTAMTGAGWVRDAGAGSEDTISIGVAAGVALVDNHVLLEGVYVNTTAAGTVTLSDAKGTIAVLKASITEGSYLIDADIACSNFLGVNLGAASDITVIHGPLLPNTYAMS